MNVARRQGIEPDRASDDSSMHIEQQPVPPLLRYRVPPRSINDIIVTLGDQVLRGHTLVESVAAGPASLHAGSSGTISKKLTASDGTTTIEISTDGCDTNATTTPIGDDFRAMSQIELQQLLHRNGMVGLGGARYPVANKLAALKSKPASLLLINAVECDPAIQCDRATILSMSHLLARAIDITAHVCNAEKTIVAIKVGDDKVRDTLLAALTEVTSANVTLRSVQDRYPIGFERHLFDRVTSHKLPAQQRPTHQNLISFNLATCISITQLIDAGEPLTSRITTVHGPQTGIARNIQIRLGTPIADLLSTGPTQWHSVAYSGLIREPAAVDQSRSITPASNCVMLNPRVDTTAACIRCGLCADSCPESLQPQQLLRHALQMHTEQLQNHQLDNCIECGLCDSVCPSNIALTRTFQQAKRTISQHKLSALAAERARVRYEARQKRIEQQRDDNARKLARKQAALAQKEQSTETDPRKLMLQSALKRRNKKTGAKPRSASE